MQIGHVVKFTDSDGKLNGGTIVQFTKNQASEDVALINTFTGDRISVSIQKLIKVAHQRSVVTDKFKKKIQKEIEASNASTSDDRKKREFSELNDKYCAAIAEVNKYKNEVDKLTKDNAKLADENYNLKARLESYERENVHGSEIEENRKYLVTNLIEAVKLKSEDLLVEKLTEIISHFADV